MAYSFCPHHVSHYLGLDVHDTGRVKRSVPLQPGMVLTIEPGYIFYQILDIIYTKGQGNCFYLSV